MELDGKACAAVGQSGLMALYDSLFSQVQVFRTMAFKQLGHTFLPSNQLKWKSEVGNTKNGTKKLGNSEKDV